MIYNMKIAHKNNKNKNELFQLYSLDDLLLLLLA